mgnify:CR=1 FL=1
MTHPDASTPIRAFLALPVPTEAVTYATVLQGMFRDQGIKGRRVRPEAMHITVEFLGDQAAEALERLCAALRQHLPEMPVPVVHCLGPDTFGRPPSVLYVAWEDEEFRFRRLAEGVRGVCREVQLAPPAGAGKKKPIPHLTFLRLKDPQARKQVRKLRRNTDEGADWRPFLPPVPQSLSNVRLDRMELISSVLTPDGPEYETLEIFELGGREPSVV